MATQSYRHSIDVDELRSVAVAEQLIEHIGQRGAEAELSKPLTPEQIEENIRHGFG